MCRKQLLSKCVWLVAVSLEEKHGGLEEQCTCWSVNVLLSCHWFCTLISLCGSAGFTRWSSTRCSVWSSSSSKYINSGGSFTKVWPTDPTPRFSCKIGSRIKSFLSGKTMAVVHTFHRNRNIFISGIAFLLSFSTQGTKGLAHFHENHGQFLLKLGYCIHAGVASPHWSFIKEWMASVLWVYLLLQQLCNNKSEFSVVNQNTFSISMHWASKCILLAQKQIVWNRLSVLVPGWNRNNWFHPVAISIGLLGFEMYTWNNDKSCHYVSVFAASINVVWKVCLLFHPWYQVAAWKRSCAYHTCMHMCYSTLLRFASRVFSVFKGPVNTLIALLLGSFSTRTYTKRSCYSTTWRETWMLQGLRKDKKLARMQPF